MGNCVDGIRQCCLPSRETTSGVQQELDDHIRKKGRTSTAIDMSVLHLNNDPSRNFKDFYTTTKQLGAGAFGTVYLVEHIATKQQRAAKMIPLTNVKEDRNLVIVELEAMIMIEHPNVCQFFEYFAQKKEIVMVTELCTAGDFGLLRGTKPAPHELRCLFRDVMMAVAYCHDLKIVHRDLKFENCLLAEGKKRRIAKVIDFGLSAIRRETVEHTHRKMSESEPNRSRSTTSGFGAKNEEMEDDHDHEEEWLTEALGTKYFVAPEVVDQSVKYGAKCDIWSFGVMMYIVLTSEHPFARDAPKLEINKLFAHILGSRIRKEPLHKAKVDKIAVDLLVRLLERDASTRIDGPNALLMEWLNPVDGSSKLDKRKTQDILGGLQDYSDRTNFEKVLLMLVAQRVKLSQVEKARALFSALDTRTDGSLSFSEFKKGLAQVGMAQTDEEAQRSFDSLDLNEDSKVNYLEFISATMDRSLCQGKNQLRETFDYFDKDQSGHISSQELIDVVGEEEAAQVLRQHDTSHDDLLSFDEFEEVMNGLAEKRFLVAL